MKRWPLSQRLSATFAALLMLCCAASAWLQIDADGRREQEVVQRLSLDLAAHIARHSALMEPDGLNPRAVSALFEKLMDVNPSVEVYLLELDGRIAAPAAADGRLRRDRVDVAPVHRLLAHEPLPILGDDPRSERARKVFSAAPLVAGGHEIGYVYVVLFGQAREALAGRLAENHALRTALWLTAGVGAVGLLVGLAAFHWITRPLRRLILEVRGFEAGEPGVPRPAAPVPDPGDDIGTLQTTFEQLKDRVAAHWRELASRDRQRRDMVANISHDLRTPLTSLHGYLETLRLKAATLSEAERQRYLGVALAQSSKVGALAQQLFDLARLECGAVTPDVERFALDDLVQDVFQKFELAARARRQRLRCDIAPGLPGVRADLGMIERVLTNLLDNAIRHTPEGGEITVRLRREGAAVAVQVSDTGPGIPPALQQRLFERPTFESGGTASAGGLGLVIVRRILQLHGCDIRLVRGAADGRGAVFRFWLHACPELQATST